MDWPVVEMHQGKLQGDTGTDLNGEPFFRFRGIPYAKPPVGDLRFKVALPAESWSGIKDATKNGDWCFQIDWASDELIGSEDCLHLNVFTKELPSPTKSLRPVMVYIHGGGFSIGSNDTDFTTGPEYLMTEDIVLVTINYRIGLLGFLSVEDSSLGIPGNNGLKDQSLALKWIQNYIFKFNGDPNNVTIFGHSAGAASVHFHILSSMSKGLFHKAILLSGCALNPWAWGTRGNARTVAETLGHTVSNERVAVDILRKTPVKELYRAQLLLPDSLDSSFKRTFGPVIERPNESAFLTKEPLKLLKTGEYNKVPIIFGHTDREGMITEFSKVFKYQLHFDGWEHAIPRQLNVIPNSEDHVDIMNKMKNTYNGPDKKDNDYLLYTDSMFVAQIIESVKCHIKTNVNPIYFYVFTLETQLNCFKLVLNLQHVKGVCHGDDMGYLFKNFIGVEITPGSMEQIAIKRFIKLVTNFASTGNPSPSNSDLKITWKPVESETHIDYLHFGEELVMEVNPASERMQLWRGFFEKFSMEFNNLIISKM